MSSYTTITGKSRLLRQRLNMLHNIMYVVIIVCGVLLFADVDRFFGLFCVIFFLSAFMDFERGITGNPKAKGRNAQAIYLIGMMSLALVMFVLGVITMIIALRR